MEAARDVSMDMVRGSVDAAAATNGRCNEVACNLSKMEKALRGIFLDIHSINESTIHPANGLLIQALEFSDDTDLVQSVHHTNDHYSHMLDCWVSKLEKDAEMIRPGEKGGKYIFLLNNIYDVLQMMRHPGATFANAELVSRLISMIQRYKKSYMDEFWVSLNNTHTLHLNLDEFTAKFFLPPVITRGHGRLQLNLGTNCEKS